MVLPVWAGDDCADENSNSATLEKTGISEFNLKRNSDLALFNLSSVESSLGTLRLHF